MEVIKTPYVAKVGFESLFRHLSLYQPIDPLVDHVARLSVLQKNQRESSTAEVGAVDEHLAMKVAVRTPVHLHTCSFIQYLDKQYRYN